MVAMVQSRFGAAAAAAAHRPGPLLVGSDSDDSDVEMVSQLMGFLGNLHSSPGLFCGCSVQSVDRA